MNTIKINIEYIEDSKALETTVYIDGELVTWGFVEPINFFQDVVRKGINLPYFLREKSKAYYYTHKSTCFEPFTCSCGVAGCAGIWNGIMTKHRRYTVEWRCEKEDGYHFIKTFYSFDKWQYINAITAAYKQLKELIDRNVIIEEYGYDGFISEMYKYDYYWTQIQEYFDKRIENAQ